MSVLFLDIALSLIVVFVMLSIFCSSLLEWYAQRVGARAKFLRKGMLHMLGDDGLYRQVVNHPLIEALGKGSSHGPGPSYIPSTTFADALLDSVVDRATSVATGDPTLNIASVNVDAFRVHLTVLHEAKFSVASALAPIARRATDMEKVRAEVANWYEAQTDRVTGWYKQYARTRLLVIGLLVAIGFNVDMVAIVQQIAEEPGLRSVLTGYAADDKFMQIARVAAEDATTLEADPKAVEAVRLYWKKTHSLPFGWDREAAERLVDAGIWGKVLVGLGWLLTALGVSLGAPFWFDLLNKVASLRAAGPKPPVAEVKKS